jgi:uncharacterized protein YjiS (DUF1127 family)
MGRVTYRKERTSKMNAVTKITPAPGGEAVQQYLPEFLALAGTAAVDEIRADAAEADRSPSEGQTFWRAMGNRLIAFVRRRITERALGALDDHALKDIGLHRSEIVSAVRHGDRRSGKGPIAPWSAML